MNPLRPQPDDSAVIRTHDLQIDTASCVVQRAGQVIALTPREYDLLHLLALRLGQVVNRSQIHQQLYGTLGDGSNVVDVYIRYLRAKIDKGFDPPLILTRRGQGYLLRADAGQREAAMEG